MSFIISQVPFKDWIPHMTRNKKIIVVDNVEKVSHIGRLLPLSVENYTLFNRFHNNVFPNNMKSVNILDDKSRFAEFMKKHFQDHAPYVLYYNYDNVEYLSETMPCIHKFILKPNKGFAGGGIHIINDLKKRKKHHVVQEYIEHNVAYVGHFLILHGRVLKKVYFYSSHNKNEIKRGPIRRYQITETLDFDDSIFNDIFRHLNYSGFACPEFIFVNDRIVIFEINPRPGGSLVQNHLYFDIFIDCLDQHTVRLIE